MTRDTLHPPFITFNRPDKWDRWTIGFYLIATAVVFWLMNSGMNMGSKKNLLLAYATGTQVLLYLANYRSLRNFTVYLVWCGIALVHFCFYLYFHPLPELKTVRGHAATGLRDTLYLLLLFQLLRWVSLKVQKQELVAPAPRSKTDLFEERTINWMDFLLFVVYMFTMVFLSSFVG